MHATANIPRSSSTGSDCSPSAFNGGTSSCSESVALGISPSFFLLRVREERLVFPKVAGEGVLSPLTPLLEGEGILGVTDLVCEWRPPYPPSSTLTTRPLQQMLATSMIRPVTHS
jgi:hypothetical protein